MHRPRRDLRRLSFGLRGVRRQHPRLANLADDCGHHGGPAGMLGRVWITDRGMASADNLTWLRQTGRRYIIGAPKSELKKFALELARPEGWRMVNEGVEVKLTRHPETDETVILCRSADRRSKERAMHDKFSQRIEEALGRLAARLTRSKTRVDPATVNRQIGRILQQNQRSAARFAITLEPDGCPAGFRLGVVYNAAFDDWAAICCVRTSTIGAIDSSGRPISSSPKPKPLFASRRTNSTSVQSGTSARIACRLISSSAFLPSCCGRAWRCGRAAQVSVIRRASSWKNSNAFSPRTSFCRPQRMARFVCAA